MSACVVITAGAAGTGHALAAAFAATGAGASGAAPMVGGQVIKVEGITINPDPKV